MRFHHILSGLVALAATLSLVQGQYPGKIDKEYTEQFEDKFVAPVRSPTDMYFTPDNKHAFVTSKFGKIWRIKVEDMENNKGQPEEVFEIPHPMCLNGARGLAGIAIHPEYPAKPYIYVFHNHDKYSDCEVSTDLDKGPVNRMSRWTLNADLKSVDPRSELVFFETQRLGTQTHNSGDIEFGADGMVYVTVGESGSKQKKDSKGNYHPVSKMSLMGSVLRMTDDGNIPADNPFVVDEGSERCGLSGGTSKKGSCQEIFAMGFRNPFRFAKDPNAERDGKTRFFVNDVGGNVWEAAKEVGDHNPGVNYGYPLREGPCEGRTDKNCYVDPDFAVPPYYYHHQEEHGGAITGGAFTPDDAGWPSSLRGAYIYAEFAIGGIYAITPDESERCDYPRCDPPKPAYKNTPFSDKKKVVGLQFGPHKNSKAMYYLVHLPSGRDGEGINRITYTGTSNRDPIAAIDASANVGFLPFTVSFDASKSYDPDEGDTAGLRYEWDFDGDGVVDSSASSPEFVYTKAGTFYPKLTVFDSKGGSHSTTVRIDVDNSPPVPRILTPFPGTTFAVGDKIVLSGEAYDEEDGKLEDSQLTWEVKQHHNNHYHPFLDATTGNNIRIDDAPPPEDFFELTTQRSYLAIHLTATDSNGLSSTTVMEVWPRLVNLQFDSEPSGMELMINAEKFTTPVNIISWENHEFELEGLTQKSPSNGEMMSLRSWSEGEVTGKTTADYTVPVKDPSRPIVAKFHPAKPVPTIQMDKDFVFSVGDTFELMGRAKSADGATDLPDESLTWEVRLYSVEGDSFTTLLPPTKGNNFNMPKVPSPDNIVFDNASVGRNYGEDAERYNSPDVAGLGYLEIILTATDADGKADTARQIIEPDIVEIALDTVPSGLELTIADQVVKTPTTVSTWRDHSFEVRADGGYLNTENEVSKYEFSSWSNGKGRTHKLQARKDETVIAEFTKVSSVPLPGITGYREGRDHFKVGEEYVLTGDGTGEFSWTANLYSINEKGDKVHRTIATEKGSDFYLTIPNPESVREAQTGYIEVLMTANDPWTGILAERSLIMKPSLSEILLTSDPEGFVVIANGEQFATPKKIVAWQRQNLELDVPESQRKTGGRDYYNWWSWSDEDDNQVYTANISYVVPRPKHDGTPREITAIFSLEDSPYATSTATGSGLDENIKIIIAVASLAAVVIALGVVVCLVFRQGGSSSRKHVAAPTSRQRQSGSSNGTGSSFKSATGESDNHSQNGTLEHSQGSDNGSMESDNDIEASHHSYHSQRSNLSYRRRSAQSTCKAHKAWENGSDAGSVASSVAASSVAGSVASFFEARSRAESTSDAASVAGSVSSEIALLPTKAPKQTFNAADPYRATPVPDDEATVDSLPVTISGTAMQSLQSALGNMECDSMSEASSAILL